MMYYLITCHFVDFFFFLNSELDGLCPRPSIYNFKGKARETAEEETCQKRLIGRINIHMIIVWQICKHAGKEKYYNVFKDALNAATNEDRTSKRNFEYNSNMGKAPRARRPTHLTTNLRMPVGPSHD